MCAKAPCRTLGAEHIFHQSTDASMVRFSLLLGCSLLCCAAYAPARSQTTPACWDRPSCLSLVSNFERKSLDTGTQLPTLWHRALAWAKSTASALPDRGGGLAAPAHKADPSVLSLTHMCCDVRSWRVKRMRVESFCLVPTPKQRVNAK